MIRHEKLQLMCHNTTNIHVLQQNPVICYLLLYCVIFTFFALSYHIDLWFITFSVLFYYNPHPLGAPGTRAFTRRPPITYIYIYIYMCLYALHYHYITLYVVFLCHVLLYMRLYVHMCVYVIFYHTVLYLSAISYNATYQNVT